MKRRLLRCPGLRFACVLLLLGSPARADYPHESEPIGSVREVYDGRLLPGIQVNTFRSIHRLLPTRTVRAAATPRPLAPAACQLPFRIPRPPLGPV